MEFFCSFHICVNLEIPPLVLLYRLCRAILILHSSSTFIVGNSLLEDLSFHIGLTKLNTLMWSCTAACRRSPSGRSVGGRGCFQRLCASSAAASRRGYRAQLAGFQAVLVTHVTEDLAPTKLPLRHQQHLLLCRPCTLR